MENTCKGNYLIENQNNFKIIKTSVPLINKPKGNQHEKIGSTHGHVSFPQ